MQKIPIDSHSNENFICLFFRPPGADNPQTTSFLSMMFALPWAKISRRSRHPALRYPQPYKQTKKTKQVRQPYAQLIPRGVVHGPLKGTKHICNQCFYTGKFWRWFAHVPPVYRLQTTKGEKLQNCTSHVLAHPVDTWGKIRQYKWHSCTGEIPTFIFGRFLMCRYSLSFLGYKEVNSRNCQKSINFRILWATV